MSEQDTPRITGYEMLEFLARGGTAQVWKARDSAGRIVAVKILDDGDGPCSRSEWQALRRFSSDHVVGVIDLVTDDLGRSALVLEYCAGGSLADTVLGRGGLTVGETIAALRPIAHTLARLHEAQVVHGDLHPRNVLFTAAGEPKLADLGCVRRESDDSPSDWWSEGFTAPEVLDGAPVKAAADGYSLGAVAWFALLGEPPPLPALRPRLRDVLPDVPAALCDAVASCLSLTPSARMDAAAFADALGAAAEPVAVPVSDVRASAGMMTRRRRSDAVRRQAAGKPGRHRTTRASRRRLVFIGVAAAAAVTVGLLLPPPGHRSGAASRASSSATLPASPKQAASGRSSERFATPSPKRTVAPVQFPTRAEVEALLQCRARAWNGRSIPTLNGCLAPESQALADDTKRLAEAAAQNVSFSGLGYSLANVERVSLEAGRPTVRVTIRQAPYSVRDAGGTRSVPAENHRVRLTLAGVPGSWKLATWNVV